MTERKPLQLAVLVSGEGTTMVAVAEAIRKGALPARIVLVASDRPSAPALAKAQALGLPTLVVSPKDGAPGSWQDRLGEALVRSGAELVVLAGFLRVLGAPLCRRFEGRILNTHPSLLPLHSGVGMYGIRVHAAVLSAGERETGATVHLVTPEVDRGPVLAQERLQVRPGETAQALSDRQKPVEHRLLVQVLSKFASGELPLPYPLPAPPSAP